MLDDLNFLDDRGRCKWIQNKINRDRVQKDIFYKRGRQKAKKRTD